jgi:Ethanolamine utilization protein EutJ (predicted chaperonin)
VTDPRTAAPPGDSPGNSAASLDVAPRIEAAGHDIVGVSDGPLAEAMVRLDALHHELQGALADLDQA